MALPISVNDSDFAKSRRFHFHETSHLRSFANIKTSRKFQNLQYINRHFVHIVIYDITHENKFYKETSKRVTSKTQCFVPRDPESLTYMLLCVHVLGRQFGKKEETRRACPEDGSLLWVRDNKVRHGD